MAARKYPQHKFWGPNDPNCPPDLLAPNGELCDMRCKVCGDGWRESHDVCFGSEAPQPVAWLHTVKQHGGNGTEDQALSFSPDNFPLQGEEVGMFYSIGKPEPLFLWPHGDGVPEPSKRLPEGSNSTQENDHESSTTQAWDVGVDVAGAVAVQPAGRALGAQAAGAEGAKEPCGHMKRGVTKWHCRRCMEAAYPGVPYDEAVRRFLGIDGPRRGPVADGSQKPNDAAAIPCAKAGSNHGVKGDE